MTFFEVDERVLLMISEIFDVARSHRIDWNVDNETEKEKQLTQSCGIN